MAFQTENGRGALFKNDRKEPGSKQPDYRGECVCVSCGEPQKMAGWKQRSKKGMDYLSLVLELASESEKYSKKDAGSTEEEPWDRGSQEPTSDF